MGDYEAQASACVESLLGYHSSDAEVLTCGHESGRGTLLGGQFDWGGRLLKGIGAVSYTHLDVYKRQTQDHSDRSYERRQ